ncbi:MAG: amidohydrolase family protein [Prosthecobacter sp.]
MNRRNFLLSTSATLAASSLRAAETTRLIDCHVYLGSHPFRHLAGEEGRTFAESLRRRGVTEAWAGAFEGLLRRDISDVNRILMQRCSSDALFRPCGTVNPALPDWQDELRRCAEDHGMRVIRLHPNYHGYALADPAVRELLILATKHGLLVQIVAQMEDARTQNPQVQVAAVDLKPLPAVMREIADARVMLLNANASMVLRHLQDCPNTTLDFAMIEGVGGVENLLKNWRLDRLVFGSFAPVFYWESSHLKIQESGLDEGQTASVCWENATALLG